MKFISRIQSSLSEEGSRRSYYLVYSLAFGVYRIPMDGYAEKIERLRENTLENTEFGTDCLEGDVAVDKKKILCVATPYSAGWKAFVDGKEQPLLCLNRHYPGLVLEPGVHHIRLAYVRPYGRAGLPLTLAGFLGTALIAAVTEKKRRSAAEEFFP